MNTNSLPIDVPRLLRVVGGVTFKEPGRVRKRGCVHGGDKGGLRQWTIPISPSQISSTLPYRQNLAKKRRSRVSSPARKVSLERPPRSDLLICAVGVPPTRGREVIAAGSPQGVGRVLSNERV